MTHEQCQVMLTHLRRVRSGGERAAAGAQIQAGLQALGWQVTVHEALWWWECLSQELFGVGMWLEVDDGTLALCARMLQAASRDALVPTAYPQAQP